MYVEIVWRLSSTGGVCGFEFVTPRNAMHMKGRHKCLFPSGKVAAVIVSNYPTVVE
jgi:hypothetical protein